MFLSGAGGPVDVFVAFFRAAAEITDRLPSLGRRVFPAGAVWALWPRRAAGHVSDITDNGGGACASSGARVTAQPTAKIVSRSSRAVSDWRGRGSWDGCRGPVNRAPATR